MRAVLTNFGTMGDVGPFLALAVELRAHGHEPLMALSPYYALRVAQLHLPFTPIGPDLQQVQNEINIAMTTINHFCPRRSPFRRVAVPGCARSHMRSPPHR
jgi:UDP:flavonoid glycosyltransferase YjiC (YdhE family)